MLAPQTDSDMLLVDRQLDALETHLLQAAANRPPPDRGTTRSPLANYILAGGGPLMLLYAAFVVYALAGAAPGAHPQISAACGDALWILTLVNLILAVLCPMLLYCVAALLDLVLNNITRTAPLTFALFIALNLTFVGLGATYGSRAGAAPACVDLLTRASFTETPLLLHLTYVNVVLNGLGALLVSALMCSAAMMRYI